MQHCKSPSSCLVMLAAKSLATPKGLWSTPFTSSSASASSSTSPSSSPSATSSASSSSVSSKGFNNVRCHCAYKWQGYNKQIATKCCTLPSGAQLTAHPRRVTVSMNAKFVGCTNHRVCHKMLQLPLCDAAAWHANWPFGFAC